MTITSDLRGFALVCDKQTKKTLLMAADRIDAENAKLRELLGNVGHILFSLDIDYCGACTADNVNRPCPVYTVESGECLYKTAMRKLGIEVEQ